MTPEIALKAFLGHLDTPHQTALLDHLAPSIRNRLAQLPSYKIAHSNQPLLESIHWSWFVPILRSFSPLEQRWALSLLPKRLEKELGETPATPTQLGRTYLAEALFLPLADGYLPLSWLPPSPLLRLAHLSKRQLIALIDHLALHDLATALKYIVQTGQLKQIQSQLTESEKRHLKSIPLSPYPRLELERWQGDPAEFRNLLHRRGLLHLAAALSREPPALLWHVAHRLDIGRGTFLCRCNEEIPPSLVTWSTEKLSQNIETL